MTSRFEKERAKQIQDKCQDLLTQMLRDEDNKYCVDCDAKGPRWASWNLGIFLCIRCAGIHRNLGVHISKVKSVNLDTWTPEQVVSLQQMGNSRARAVYEANLPDSFRRPQTDCSLESFIRAKYEHKKYIAREWVPPPLPKVNWDKELDEEAERQRRRKKEGTKSSTSQNSLPPVKKPEVVPQIPKPRSSVSPKPTRANNSATLDLLGLDAPVNQANANGSSSGDDIFSSFLSATPANASPAPTGVTNGSAADVTSAASKTEEENFFNQPAPTAQEKSKMTKDSILALYGTPSHQASAFGAPGGGIYAQQPPVQQFAQPVQNIAGFGQPNSFSSQPNSFPSQPNSFPSQPNSFSSQPNSFPSQTNNFSSQPTSYSSQPNSFSNQPNTFPSQPNAMGQLGQLQGQMGMPVTNQMNLTTNQIGLNSSQMVHPVNPIANSLHMGPVSQINGMANNAMTMQNQMGVTQVNPQMMQMQGQNPVSSNNGWSGMMAAQNLQPAPGSNPFFNLPAQPQLNTPFGTQLPQQMSQMSLGGLGKPTSTALPGQPLSTNLWQ